MAALTSFRRAIAPIVLALQVLVVPPSSAGPNANAKIVLHSARVDRPQCGNPAASPPCSGIVAQGDLYPAVHMLYVLVTDGDATAGLAGVQFGATYNDAPGQGVDVFIWTLCATLQFPEDGWPASGTGNLVTWDPVHRCQRMEPGGAGTGVTAQVGFFYCAAYSADTLRIVPRPVDGAAKVASCAAFEDVVESAEVRPNPSHLGFAAFSPGGTAQGYNPCGLVTPVRSATWGRIKAMVASTRGPASRSRATNARR